MTPRILSPLKIIEDAMFPFFLRGLRKRFGLQPMSSRRVAAKKARPMYRLSFDCLEDRWLPSTITVTGTGDDGPTGGAIHIATIGAFTLTIDSCNITGTLAGAGAATRGGAVSVTGLNDSLIVTNCTINGTVTTTNTVSNNDAGALYVATNQTESVTNSTLSGDVSGSTTNKEGGDLYM